MAARCKTVGTRERELLADGDLLRLQEKVWVQLAEGDDVRLPVEVKALVLEADKEMLLVRLVLAENVGVSTLVQVSVGVTVAEWGAGKHQPMPCTRLLVLLKVFWRCSGPLTTPKSSREGERN